MIKFCLVDFGGTGVSQDDLTACAAALTRQFHEMVSLAPPLGWGIDAECRAAAGPTDIQPHEWVIGLLAHADQPGALGYHDKTPSGQPFAKVFPLLDAQDGAAWQQTVSHEAIEAACDPEANVIMQSPDGTLWAAEQCDACEQGVVAIDGVPLSDFLCPPWYSGSGVGPCNWLQTLQPGEVGPGGYAQQLTPTGWIQVQHAEVAPRAYRQQHQGRRARRQGR